MPTLKTADAEIYYEEHGAGFPLMIFAPGGLRSELAFWRESPSNPGARPAWMDPMSDLAGTFRVVAMDQRNAGRSTGSVAAGHGWDTYARDHLALMDHLGIERAHVMGGCIGASFCLKLCEMAPQRVAAAVLQNPIGHDNNRQIFANLVKIWADGMKAKGRALDGKVVESFGRNLFGGDFVFSVTRDFVRGCRIPMLVMPGDDAPHPAAVAHEVAKLAPVVEVMHPWKGPDHLRAAIQRVRDFLERHTPAPKSRASAA
ncbi:MAG TPA: alpha/beta fold hydrolase [Stellaceae bacterium]|nr:alpha/beta fold hydrolase [Stellaceae bacterium]